MTPVKSSVVMRGFSSVGVAEGALLVGMLFCRVGVGVWDGSMPAVGVADGGTWVAAGAAASGEPCTGRGCGFAAADWQALSSKRMRAMK